MRSTAKICICILLSAALLASSCAAAETAAEEPSQNAVQINPLAEGVSMDDTMVRLYYAFGNARLLAGENRKIKVPANESIEASVLSELVRTAPSDTGGNLRQVINSETTVTDVSIDGQFATVTFSAAFLNPWPEDGETRTADTERVRKYLAVYSVVNTLVELGNCSRVRIMIDDGMGTARPITFAEAGMPGTGDAQPFERNGDIELTPGVTMRSLLSAVERRDWTQAYSFIAYRNQRGQDKPDAESFRSQAESARFVVSEAEVLDYVMAADGSSVIVMVSYNITTTENGVRQFTNVPKRLVLEGDVWKMTWNVFEETFVKP